MSKYAISPTMREKIKFFIDELHNKIHDWSEYDIEDLDKLIDIVSEYPEIFPKEYEDKFQDIIKEFRKKKNI